MLRGIENLERLPEVLEAAGSPTITSEARRLRLQPGPHDRVGRQRERALEVLARGERVAGQL